MVIEVCELELNGGEGVGEGEMREGGGGDRQRGRVIYIDKYNQRR